MGAPHSPGPGRTPTLLVAGLDADAMAAVATVLAFDLPRAVSVRHDLDPGADTLTRTVSDIGGILEREVIPLEHACIPCAIREDIVPTLERLAADGRWGAVVAQLPPTAEAVQVCRMIGYQPDVAPHVHVAAVVAALDGTALPEDLVAGEELVEAGLPVRADDGRAVAEVACAIVEYADVVALTAQPDADALAFLEALTRPGTRIIGDVADLDGAAWLAGLHDCDAADAWVAPIRRAGEPFDAEAPRPGSRVWRLEVRSERPLHPGRLWEAIERVGGGGHRARGCFWLPTRPDTVCVWDGAGGQLSIGADGPWGADAPRTHLIVVGIEDPGAPLGTARARLRRELEQCLVSNREIRSGVLFRETGEDGLEDWLGPVHRAA